MSDMVNHPAHYQSKSGLEVIDVIESWELNYRLGCAIKYILRSDKKGAFVQDLKKCIWYIQREIDSIAKDTDVAGNKVP